MLILSTTLHRFWQIYKPQTQIVDARVTARYRDQELAESIAKTSWSNNSACQKTWHKTLSDASIKTRFKPVHHQLSHHHIQLYKKQCHLVTEQNLPRCVTVAPSDNSSARFTCNYLYRCKRGQSTFLVNQIWSTHNYLEHHLRQTPCYQNKNLDIYQSLLSPPSLKLPLTRHALNDTNMSTIPLDSFRQDRPLAESIAIATRGIHAKLNKLIIARLPLVLPPQASDSFVYASGLLHIAPIYTTFESLWSDILHNSKQNERDNVPGEPKRNAGVSDGLRETLDLLCVPGLKRADLLVADIQSMTGWTEVATREQLAIISKTGHLAEVVSHIRRAIKNKPHVLLAYSYIMYMALFAGGRFIRATLESAGKEFWDTTASPIVPTSQPCKTKGKEDAQDTDMSLHVSHSLPLRFFHFDTAEDGEDLKRDFKQKLADCEGLLSYREKHDIVQEAICIFENMVLVVAQLDNVMASGHQPTTVPASAMLGRFRDSVVVTRERSARTSGLSFSSSSSSSSSGSDSDSEGDNKTPADTGDTLPSKPDNHPTIPSTTGMESCPALSKSMRFEKTLPHPSRPLAGDSTVDLAESLKMASKRLRREQVTNWVFGVAIGIIIVGALFSGRRAASMA